LPFHATDMRTLITIAIQIVALLVINGVGYALAAALQLPLPGNLLGMLLLLSLLATGLVPLRWVESSASVLIRHLGFFFVPITVGLMSLGELFLDNGVAILITLVVSAVIGIGVAGFSSQRLTARRDRRAS
jgi:Putative effector of murein hydrolase LrgA